MAKKTKNEETAQKNKTKQTTAKSDDLRYPNADKIYE